MFYAFLGGEPQQVHPAERLAGLPHDPVYRSGQGLAFLQAGHPHAFGVVYFQGVVPGLGQAKGNRGRLREGVGIARQAYARGGDPAGTQPGSGSGEAGTGLASFDWRQKDRQILIICYLKPYEKTSI